MRQRQGFDLVALEFESHGLTSAPIGVALEEVGARHRVDQIEEAREDAIIIEARHFLELLGDELLGRGFGLGTPFRLEIGIEARIEQGDEGGGDFRLAHERLRHIALRVADRRLLQIARQRPHQGDIAPGEARRSDQRVESIALALAFAERHQRFLEARREA